MKPLTGAVTWLAATLVTTTTMAGPALAQNAGRGAVLFSVECAACHSTIPGENRVGPSLAGIYGSRAATVPGFDFSLALRQSHIVWTNATLEAFLVNPNNLVTGTAMPNPTTEMHLGVPDAIDRADIIAYLRTLKK